ncbi:L,D-transpeptidase family protein [Sphingorhabdus sp.]|uniref:L,D-transpeptidase family protein n=1 Tax=Sphingorhabdus sp. TaxID=1902408 RepID=UPI00391AD667
MRNGIIIALLVLLVTGSFALVGKNFSGSSRQSVVQKAQFAGTQGLALPRHRDLLSNNDARLLAEQKLAPPEAKSLLKVPVGMRHGDFVWNEDGVPKGDVIIWVDLRRQMISAYRHGHEIGTAVIVYGAEDMSSPEGRFPVLNKQRNYHSRTYDAPMPASLFITNDGVALHGSPMSSRRASHGCIGLPVEFAEKLFDATDVGNIVEITRSAHNASQRI